jgi:glycosyltransferase involved in cell wall biosynthesis
MMSGNLESSPLVSVYVITHNRAHLLPAAIDSVIAQSYENFEIIIVDDASTDDTSALCHALSRQHKNIKYFVNPTNKGANFSRNRALDQCRGKFVTGLDDDDCFLPERLQNFIAEWDDRYAFLCTDFIRDYGESTKLFYGSGGVFEANRLLFFNHASNQIFTLRARLGSACRFNESLKRLQDWECWLRLAMTHGSFKRLRTATYVMNETHELQRVSSSLKYKEALTHFLACNPELFSDREKEIFTKYLIDQDFSSLVSDMFRPLDVAVKAELMMMYIRLKLWRFF